MLTPRTGHFIRMLSDCSSSPLKCGYVSKEGLILALAASLKSSLTCQGDFEQRVVSRETDLGKTRSRDPEGLRTRAPNAGCRAFGACAAFSCS